MSPKANLLIHEKYPDKQGSIAEIKIWIVPVSGHHPHGYKYSLVLIVKGKRVVTFDNERGKGDHKHMDGIELPYSFESIDKLLTDYNQTIKIWKEKHRDYHG